uniref:Ufm1-specific protease 2 n=1 Tax=Panagrellus redivivus TaxID=6233 RepID=A0A7E4VXU1_PANRE
MTPPVHINVHSLFKQYKTPQTSDNDDDSKLYLYGYKSEDKHVHVVNAVVSEKPKYLFEALLPVGLKLLDVIDIYADEPRPDALINMDFEDLDVSDKESFLAKNSHIIDEFVAPPAVQLGSTEVTFLGRVFDDEGHSHGAYKAIHKLIDRLWGIVFLGDLATMEPTGTGEVFVNEHGRIITLNLKITGLKNDLTEAEKAEYVRRGLIQVAEIYKHDGLSKRTSPFEFRITEVDGQQFFLVADDKGGFLFEQDVAILKQIKPPVEKPAEKPVEVLNLAPDPPEDAGDASKEPAKPEEPIELNFGNLLLNPHIELTYKPKDLFSVIKSNYIYYHYDCDGFDDSGWGCAYRSLQTIWSWLNYKGRVNRLPPSHKEVQECLVSIGDKPSKFIGSRGWIGSFEIGFVMQNLANLEFQTLSSSSGKELDEHGRRLVHHFENDGAPVMIGGGQLAHTIIGVDYNRRTGECFYLILDPHYVGKDTTAAVFKGKGVSWQPNKFFNGKGHYNMLLVQN